MKRFLLFCGSNYYPDGGWHDYAGDFETLDQATTEAERSTSFDHRFDWWHVVDTTLTGPDAIVARSQYQGTATT